jgi:hypothetical protein
MSPPRYQPSLTVTESAGCIRLQLGGLARGEGASLQEAADDLVRRILALAMAFRSSGLTASFELAPDLRAIDYLLQLGEFAAAGGDVRTVLFA